MKGIGKMFSEIGIALWSALLATSLATGPSSYQDGVSFYKGFDLSSLNIQEDGGAIYKDTSKNNATRPAEAILEGMNTVRLRLWVHPVVPFDDGYYETYNLQYVTTLAKRFHSQGYHIYLDYHFSDYWADPQKQYQPKEWPTTLKPLAKTLRNYVSRTMKSLSDAGVDLSIVSLGNEIRDGMLWPLGRVYPFTESEAERVANFSNLATLYSAARKGVDDAVSAGVHKPLVMIHIDNGYNLTLQENWFGALTSAGVATSEWDIFGFSMYPFYGTDATLKNLKTTLNAIAGRYKKPIHVVETDWPNQCSGPDAPELSEPSIPVSAKGQIEWVQDIAKVLKQVPNGLGQGLNYWEPAWLNLTSLGSACQSAILFTPDWSEFPKVTGYSLPSAKMMALI